MLVYDASLQVSNVKLFRQCVLLDVNILYWLCIGAIFAIIHVHMARHMSGLCQNTARYRFWNNCREKTATSTMSGLIWLVILYASWWRHQQLFIDLWKGHSNWKLRPIHLGRSQTRSCYLWHDCVAFIITSLTRFSCFCHILIWSAWWCVISNKLRKHRNDNMIWHEYLKSTSSAA